MNATDTSAATPATKPDPRPWGEIRTRNDRPGFRVRFTHEGSEYERAAGSTWGAADKKRRQARTLIEAGIPIADVLARVFGDFHGAVLTFRDARVHYLAFAKSRKRDSTLRADVSRLRVVGRAPWTGKILGKVTPGDLIAWLAERQKDREKVKRRKMRPGETLGQFRKATDKMVSVTIPGASGATLNRDLAIVSAVYEWARRLGYVDSNPVRDVDRFTESKGREVYLTAPEANALVANCSAVLRPLVLAAIHTGMRRGELLALKWRSVDLKRREIRVEAETEKAGRGRVVPLTTALHSALVARKAAREIPALDGSDLVFTMSDGSPVPLGIVRSGFTSAATAALPLAKRGEVSFHSLRHTAASLMVAAGVPLFDVAKILGHSTLAVTMRYAHFAPKAGRAAIDALGETLAGPKARARKTGT